MSYALVAILLLALAYTSEFVLGFVLLRAIPQWFIPPYAEQRHVTDEFDVSYEYNEWGLRGDKFVAGQIYDIVLLGDSFFFGPGVNQENTVYGHLLSNGWGVFNLSECATKPIHYNYKANVAFRTGLRSRLVLFGLFVGNDFAETEGSGLDEYLAFPYPPNPLEYGAVHFLTLDRLRYLIEAFSARTLQANPLFVHRYKRKKRFHKDWLRWFSDDDSEVAREMLHSRLVKISDDHEYFRLAQISGRSLARAARTVNATGAFIQDHAGAEMLVLIIPDIHYAKGELGIRYESVIDDFKRLLDFPVIDLHGLLSEDDYFERDGHWNESGHEKVARRITQTVGELLLEDRGSPPKDNLPISGPLKRQPAFRPSEQELPRA